MPVGRETVDASRFELRGVIGRGGMGVVHRAWDTILRREIAMKILEPAAIETASGGDPDAFLAEARLAGQLDHPNIVPVHDLGFLDDGRPFLLMKLVDGIPLSRFIRERKAPARGRDLEQLLQAFLKVCDAVGFAHSRGVIHRDLKPDNVMVGSHGQVYVMDWGLADLRENLARKRDPDVERTPSGTLSYMAPEQARMEGRIDERTDVFGLGGILYAILTGAPPYPVVSDISMRLRFAEEGLVRDPREIVPDQSLSTRLCRITMKALAREPGDRYAGAPELRDAVSSFLRSGGWFETVRFSPGQIVVREGEAGDSAYLVEEGRCQVYREEAGSRTVIRELGPGEAFGETALFTAGPRIASVVALEAVSAVKITREALDDAIADGDWLGVFVRTLAERFRDLDRRRR